MPRKEGIAALPTSLPATHMQRFCDGPASAVVAELVLLEGLLVGSLVDVLKRVLQGRGCYVKEWVCGAQRPACVCSSMGQRKGVMRAPINVSPCFSCPAVREQTQLLQTTSCVAGAAADCCCKALKRLSLTSCQRNGRCLQGDRLPWLLLWANSRMSSCEVSRTGSMNSALIASISR